MAFNPFHRFRKHQKVFFAILTIICMITFVFQFGAGDVFTRGLAWFGAVGHKGDVVATLYGDKVYESDFEHVRRQRRLANEFINRLPPSGVFGSLVEGVQELDKKQQKASPDAPPPVSFGGQMVASSFLERLRQGFMQPLPREQRAAQAVGNLRMIRDELQNASVQKNPDQVRALQTLAAAVAYEAWDLERKPDEFYFGGSLKPDDLLDFLVWKHQARRLGIELSDADVIREINRAAGGRPVLAEDQPFDRNANVRLFVTPDRDRRATANVSAHELLEALRDEFQVQLAREALVGHGSGARAYVNEAEPVRMSPVAATPDEFLTYFRDHRTTLKAAFLPLNVGNFVDKVPGEPSEQDLQNRYEKYKDKVPDPRERTPGFKQPRRIRVQYANANTDSPFYQAATKKMAKALTVYSDPALSAALRVGAGFSPALAGPAGWLAVAGLPNYFDPLLKEYENYRREEEMNAGRGLGVGFDLSTRGEPKDQPLAYAGYAATVGQFLGTGLTGAAPPLTAAVTIPAVEELHRRATIHAFGSAVLAGGTASPLTALGLTFPFAHTALPRHAVGSRLVERFEKDLAVEMVRENLTTLKDELAKLRNKPAEAEKYVEKAVKEFGLQNFHGTSRLESEFEVADDPVLKPIKEAYEEFRKNPPFAMFGPQQFAPFVEALVAPPPGVYQMGWFPTIRFQGREDLVPFIMVQPGKDTWVYWRTQDERARVRPYEEVHNEVVMAWRFDKARLLARAEAERIRDAINEKYHSPADAIKYLREQKYGDEFELSNIARMVPRSTEFVPFRHDNPSDFRPYEVPADKIAFPPENFVEKLLNLQKPGDALVLADRPMKHYYVAVLEARSVPPLNEFYDLYKKSPQDDPVWMEMMKDRRREFELALTRQLRAEAVGPDKLDEQGNYVLPESVRGRGEASSESGE
jgi:hypothetical protein